MLRSIMDIVRLGTPAMDTCTVELSRHTVLNTVLVCSMVGHPGNIIHSKTGSSSIVASHWITVMATEHWRY